MRIMQNIFPSACKWDYRMVKKTSNKEICICVHAVYYNEENNPIGCSLAPVHPVGFDIYSLVLDLEKFKKAIELPILNYEIIGK
jgi:hypothetical protein